MKINKVTYIENGYFTVKYSQTNPVVQDIGGIKMTSPTDPGIKDILMFLRSLKLEKLQSEEEFDDLKYRDHVVYDNQKSIDGSIGAMSAYAASHTDGSFTGI